MRRVRGEGSQVAPPVRHFVVAALANILFKLLPVKNAGVLIISFSVILAFAAGVILTHSIVFGSSRSLRTSYVVIADLQRLVTASLK
jgi:hypothetical protein